MVNCVFLVKMGVFAKEIKLEATYFFFGFLAGYLAAALVGACAFFLTMGRK